MTFKSKKSLKLDIVELERQVKHLEAYIEDDRTFWEKRMQDLRDHHAAEWERRNEVVDNQFKAAQAAYDALDQLNAQSEFIITKLVDKLGLSETYNFSNFYLLYDDLKAEVTNAKEKSAKKARKARLKGE